MEEWICTVNDLGFHYKRGGRAVLKGLSLSLHKGEILGIRGENGAGKSTLLKAIAGILPYDKGEVLIYLCMKAFPPWKIYIFTGKYWDFLPK